MFYSYCRSYICSVVLFCIKSMLVRNSIYTCDDSDDSKHIIVMIPLHTKNNSEARFEVLTAVTSGMYCHVAW
jgi:hypothetical protein